MKERTIKLLSILLALSLLFGLVGCKAGQRKQELAEEVAAPTTVVEDDADSEVTAVDEEEAPAEEEADEDEAPAEEESADEAPAETEAEAETDEEETPAEGEVEDQEAEADEADEDADAAADEDADEAKDTEVAEDETPAEGEVEDADAEEAEASEEEEVEEEVETTVAPGSDQETPAEDEDQAETHDDKVNKLASLDADSAADYLMDKGFKVYDITKTKPLDVKRAIFAANYDPEKMMQGFKLLIESGLLDNLIGEKPENIGEVNIAKLLDKVPIDAILNYLATLKVNFYNVFYMSFEDTEAAEQAFYTGKGIISLTDTEKKQVGQVTERVKSEIPAIQKEIQKILTNYMIEHPEQASKAIALLQDILIQISQPEWIIQEEGQLVRRIAVDLPMGTIFIEEAQRDEHVFLLISLITTDDESKIIALNEGLHIFEVSPAELISLK